MKKRRDRHEAVQLTKAGTAVKRQNRRSPARDLVEVVDPQLRKIPSRLAPGIVQAAFRFALLGATDEELAALLQVIPKTVQVWKKDEAFAYALQQGKAYADANVIASLYRNAIGFEYPSSERFYDKDSGKVVVAEFMEYHKPDTTAAIFWVKCRQRERWNQPALGPGDGGGIFVQINLGQG